MRPNHRYNAAIGPIFKKGNIMGDTGSRVKKIVMEHLCLGAEQVTENASFLYDLGADSFDTVELVMAFEGEFGVEISDDAAETIRTVGEAIRYLENAA
jgi:acyl carrier protein